MAVVLQKSRDAFTKNIAKHEFLATALTLHEISTFWDEFSKFFVLCVFEYNIATAAILKSTNIRC